MRECPKCQAPITGEGSLVTDFRVARDLTRKYKEQKALKFANCPKCGYRLLPEHEDDRCPACNAPLKTTAGEKKELIGIN